MTTDGSPWPPPDRAPSPGASSTPPPAWQQGGWYLAGDGQWYFTVSPPAPGWWLASDLYWYAPELAPDGGAGWRSARWGLGDAWWGALVYAIGVIAGSFLVVAVVIALDADIDAVDTNGYVNAGFSVVAVAAFGVVPWVASRRKGSGRLADDFGLRFRPVDLAIGIGLGLGGMIAAGVVGTLLDSALGADESTTNLPSTDSASVGEMIALFVAIAVVTPVIEELFFRGLVLRSLLKRNMSTWAAVLVSNLVFVTPHLLAVPEWPGALTLFVSIAVLGFAFHVAALVTDLRLGAGIVAHAVVNGIAMAVAFAS